MLFPLPFPIPVTDVRDGWNWLVVVSAIAGVALALVAICFTAYAIRRGDKALVRERRHVFELGIIARILEISGHSQPGSREILQGLIRMVPNDLKEYRAALEKGGVPSNTSLAPFLPEFFAAVDQRLRDGDDDEA
jgi:hypothetical protein